MTRLGILLAALASSAMASAAQAIVTYDADATSTFTLVDAGGMGILFEIMPEPTPTMTTGTGVATIDADTHTPAATFAPLPDESVIIESAVSGSAAAPGGTSSALALNGVFVELTNPSMGAATATFEFSYEWFAEVTKMDDAMESGVASPFFHLTGFAPSGSETLMIDPDAGGPAPSMPMADWLVHPFVASPFGDPGATDSGADTVLAFVTLPPESINSFSVLTDATGSAATPPSIPEPMSAGLLLVAGAAIARRRATK